MLTVIEKNVSKHLLEESDSMLTKKTDLLIKEKFRNIIILSMIFISYNLYFFFTISCITFRIFLSLSFLPFHLGLIYVLVPILVLQISLLAGTAVVK